MTGFSFPCFINGTIGIHAEQHIGNGTERFAVGIVFGMLAAVYDPHLVAGTHFTEAEIFGDGFAEVVHGFVHAGTEQFAGDACRIQHEVTCANGLRANSGRYRCIYHPGWPDSGRGYERPVIGDHGTGGKTINELLRGKKVGFRLPGRPCPNRFRCAPEPKRLVAQIFQVYLDADMSAGR